MGALHMGMDDLNQLHLPQICQHCARARCWSHISPWDLVWCFVFAASGIDRRFCRWTLPRVLQHRAGQSSNERGHIRDYATGVHQEGQYPDRHPPPRHLLRRGRSPRPGLSLRERFTPRDRVDSPALRPCPGCARGCACADRIAQFRARRVCGSCRMVPVGCIPGLSGATAVKMYYVVND